MPREASDPCNHLNRPADAQGSPRNPYHWERIPPLVQQSVRAERQHGHRNPSGRQGLCHDGDVRCRSTDIGRKYASRHQEIHGAPRPRPTRGRRAFSTLLRTCQSPRQGSEALSSARRERFPTFPWCSGIAVSPSRRVDPRIPRLPKADSPIGDQIAQRPCQRDGRSPACPFPKASAAPDEGWEVVRPQAPRFSDYSDGQRNFSTEYLHHLPQGIDRFRADIVYCPPLSACQAKPVGPDHVPHIRDIPADVKASGADDRLTHPSLDLCQLTGPIGEDEIGRVPWSRVRKRADPDDIQVEVGDVSARDGLRRSFAGPVRADRQQRVVLLEGSRELRRFPIGLGRTDQQNAWPDGGPSDCLEQIPAAEDVHPECLPRVLQGAPNRRCGSQVVHLVGTDLLHDPGEALPVGDIRPNKPEPIGAQGIPPYFMQVFQRASRHDQPINVYPLRDQQVSQVGSRKPRHASHQRPQWTLSLSP